MPAAFALHEVSAGVWAAIAPGTAGPAVSNAAIVDLGDKTVVVDTFMTALAAQELAAAVERLTGRAAFLVVNSHWHSDHVRGNRVFSHLPIVGTRRMRDLIVADAPRTRQDLDDRAAELLQAATAQAATATTPAQHAEVAGTRALAAALAAEAGSYRLTVPTVLIGDRLEVEGERSLHVLGYGRGHTESDLFVHLPADGIVIAGDLVWTGIHPKTDDGFPGAWATVLDRIDLLGASAVVPGHGPPGVAADVAAMAGYLRELDALVAAVRAGDLDPAAAAPPAGSEDWRDARRFHAGLATLAGRDDR